MSLIVLHHSDVLTLASDRRVIAAEETGTFTTMVEQATLFSERVVSEDSRIADAEAQAHHKGYDAGFNEGKLDGMAAAEKLLADEKLLLAESREQLQQKATRMAFDIVRKLADNLDTADLLAALAITAARSSAPDEQFVLRVYDEHRAAVAEKLAAAGPDVSSIISAVVGDGGIDPAACILESNTSRLLADLATQASLLESRLDES